MESCYRCVWPGTGEGLQQVQAVVLTALPLESYDPEDMMALEVSMAYWDAVWSPWVFTIGEAKKRLLVFQCNALPTYAESYSPFERQLLVCSCALVETEPLKMGWKVTMQPELSIMRLKQSIIKYFSKAEQVLKA